MNETDENEHAIAVIWSAIGFIVFGFLAFFVVFIAKNIPAMVCVAFVGAATFFGWLLFLAAPKMRIAVIRWFPWF